MVEAKKLGLAGLAVAEIVALAGLAKAGYMEIKNQTTWDGAQNKQCVLVRDNYHDTQYFDPTAYPALISYIWDPNSKVETAPKLKGKGINSQNTNEVKVCFETSGNFPSDADHRIQLRFINTDMNDYLTRNLTLYQEPNNVDADPNVYDIKELTNYGTQYGYIPFRTFEPAQWIFRADNYADLNFDGKVNLEDCAV